MAWQRSELPSPVPSETPTRDPSVAFMNPAAVDDGSPQRSPLSKSFLRPADEAAVLPNVRGAAKQDATEVVFLSQENASQQSCCQCIAPCRTAAAQLAPALQTRVPSVGVDSAARSASRSASAMASIGCLQQHAGVAS